MKLLIGFLVGLNVLVFLFSLFADEPAPQASNLEPLPNNVALIKLLDPEVAQRSANCVNLGPIEQQIVLEQAEKLLQEQSLEYRLITESARRVYAYRVAIKVESAASVPQLKQDLAKAGISDSFEKTLAGGEKILSLGVFSYQHTAEELSSNLQRVGFAANTVREFLVFPQRFWLNLDANLNNEVFNSISAYAVDAEVKQSAAKCVS